MGSVAYPKKSDQVKASAWLVEKNRSETKNAAERATHNAVCDSAVIEGLSIDTRPPFPRDTLIGSLFAYLADLPLYAEDGMSRTLLHYASRELMLGVSWVIQHEWDSKFKIPYHLLQSAYPEKGNKRRRKEGLKKVAAQHGEWLRSLLEICEKLCTYTGLGTQQRSQSKMFAEIVKDLAASGGLVHALLYAYHPERGRGTASPRGVTRDMRKACSRISQCEPPDSSAGAFGQFLAEIAETAERHDRFRKGSFKNFVRATRNYIDTGDKSSTGSAVLFQREGEAIKGYRKAGKGRGFIKLKNETRATQGFQQVLAEND